MDALDALDAVGERNVQLVRQVGPGQWDAATPCAEWDVRTLVGHLITGRHVYHGFLDGVAVAELRAMLRRQGEVADCVVHSWDLATAERRKIMIFAVSWGQSQPASKDYRVTRLRSRRASWRRDRT